VEPSEGVQTAGGIQPDGDEAGTAPEDRRFRPDIQGLRAVAVLLVVLFHVDVPGLSGGYVGVDVFFVISGFVITGVLLRERAATGSTSIVRFYGRRVRRIIPAATLVIIVGIVASYALLGHVGGTETATDGRWASVFLINFHFAASGTNYLASLLPPSVLQNFWSLAVEEQFYLVYPAVFLIVAKLSWHLPLRRRLGIVLGLAVVGSFADSIIQTSSNPAAAFFSPFPRVWELALGGLIAVGTVGLRRVPPAMAAGLSWIGLGSILCAAFVFTSATPYPGWAVALPVVGAGLVIAGGVAEPQYGVECVLRCRPLQWIGLISYSWYLWHWPLLTLAAERSGTDTLPVADGLFWVVVALGLATATYVLIENPIRHNESLIARQGVSLALGGCLIVSSLAVGTVELNLHPQPASSVPGLAGLQTSALCPAPSRAMVAGLRGAGLSVSRRTTARILVVGDSTACTMLPGLEAVGGLAGVRIENAAVVGCGVVSGEIAPLVRNGKNVNSATSRCQDKADTAEAQALKQGRPTVVLWASSWERSSLVVGSGTHRTIVATDTPQWYALVTKRMEQRVQQLTATGATLVMLTQPPFAETGVSGPTAADEEFERLNALEATFALHRPHVLLVDLAARVCPSGPPCPELVDKVWARGDGAHYTSGGSLWVARWLLPRLGIKALETTSSPLPVMKVVKPSNGATLSGSEILSATSSFGLGITTVEFRFSGGTFHNVLIGGKATFTRYGWLATWDTTQVPNGVYTVRSEVKNATGDQAVSAGVTVVVANARP
jgi:peptidoglycan/LPS O-acetylase OafA/YrhL